MKRFSTFLFLVLIIVLAGGAAFLSTWDIPAPVKQEKKVLPDDRFPR